MQEEILDYTGIRLSPTAHGNCHADILEEPFASSPRFPLLQGLVQGAGSVTHLLLSFSHILSSGHRNAVPVTSIERCITVLARRAENGVPSI
jgi:hypothetical protein